MSEERSTRRNPVPDARNPWVVDTQELGRSPGASQRLERTVPAETAVGFPDVIEVPVGAPYRLDLLLESVVEGVLVSGSVTVRAAGQCSRCLDPIEEEIAVELTELFAYPDSTTEATTEEDEVSHVVDDMVDLEPVVRDAVVLAMPQVPLCRPDCPGLCPDCGLKWVDLEPDHGHEKIDPRWAALVERFSGSNSNGSAPTDSK
ncbi:MULTISPECIES: YceD family protein [Thermocrispum]|jgi:uncharacterized protein|uniref:YceD family protein n=1 Tax=Thermocrispum agreste TaxID=37925 RepID=A0ABD6FCB4_9PSEU|nr:MULTISPECIES: YceD family protein [Thermocrispum]